VGERLMGMKGGGVRVVGLVCNTLSWMTTDVILKTVRNCVCLQAGDYLRACLKGTYTNSRLLGW
jgi:hypothetical protein